MTIKRRSLGLINVFPLITIVFVLFAPTTYASNNYKLNGELVLGGDVRQSVISHDGNWVVYLVHQETDVPGIYSVPITGGIPIKLNVPLVSGAIFQFSISPDSKRVVYNADHDGDGVYDLYSVAISGGSSVKITGPANNDVRIATDFVITQDSGNVVYLARPDGITELFSVPITGGKFVKLSGPFVAGGGIGYESRGPNFAVSPDSKRVVYLAAQETYGVIELFSVAITGGTAVKLNGPLVAGGDVSLGYTKRTVFSISPDSKRVVYLADQETKDVYELFSVPITGGKAIKLNDPLVAGGDVSQVYDEGSAFIISPDSERVVYQTDEETGSVGEIFSVPITGGKNTKLTADFNFNKYSSKLLISPNSKRVVFTASKKNISNSFGLYSIAITGGAAIKLNVSGNVIRYAISPDSSHVVYSEDQDLEGDYELYTVSIKGGAVVELSVPEDGSNVFQYNSAKFSPNSQRVLFLSDRETENVNEIYSVAITGGSAVKLNGPLVEGSNGISLNFDMSPNSRRIVYKVDQEIVNVTELFVALYPDTDGDGIDDGLDNEPVNSNNACTGADALFMDSVLTDIHCGAENSITVEATNIEDEGSLVLISPVVKFKPGFSTSGELKVISANPCLSCSPF